MSVLAEPSKSARSVVDEIVDADHKTTVSVGFVRRRSGKHSA
jgi:hypothetical protein